MYWICLIFQSYLFDIFFFSNYGWPHPTTNMNEDAAAIIALLVFFLFTQFARQPSSFMYLYLYSQFTYRMLICILMRHNLNLRWRWLWSCQIAKVYWDVTDSSDAQKDHIPESLQICDWLSWYRWLLAPSGALCIVNRHASVSF